MKNQKKRWLAYVSGIILTVGVALGVAPSSAFAWHGDVEVEADCEGWEVVVTDLYSPNTAVVNHTPAGSGDWSKGDSVEGNTAFTWTNSRDTDLVNPWTAEKPNDCEPEEPEPIEPSVSLSASAECDGVISGSVGFAGGYEGSVAYVRLFHGIDGSGADVEVNLGDELSVPGSVPFTIPSGVYDEADEVLITATVLFLFEGEGLEYFDSMVVEVPTCATTVPPTTAPPTTAPPTTAPPVTSVPPATTVPATPPTPTTQPPAPPATTPILPNTGTDSPGGINAISILLIALGSFGVILYFVRRRRVVS